VPSTGITVNEIYNVDQTTRSFDLGNREDDEGQKITGPYYFNNFSDEAESGQSFKMLAFTARKDGKYF
jgi:hypothetical protein